jgi:hypothetical protein
MTIVNDDSRVVNKLEASLTDDARVIIYDRHMFIVQVIAPILNFVQPIGIGNCNIDFFNFRHRQYRSFQILNQLKQDWNFTVKFQNHRKWKQKLTKYNAIEQNQSIVMWNFVRCRNFIKFWNTFQVFHSRVGPWPCPQTLDYAGKARQGQTL